MAKMRVSNEARKEFSSLCRAFDEVNSILQTKFSQGLIMHFRPKLERRIRERADRELQQAATA